MSYTTVRTMTASGWLALAASPSGRVWAENVQMTADRGGPLSASFDVRRDPTVNLPDIPALAPVEMEVNGSVVWDGRVKETPSRSDEYVLNVQCEGWQAHLDDSLDPYLFVHDKLADWKDQRSYLNADLTVYRQAGKVDTGQGEITIGFQKDTQVPAADRAGVTFFTGGGPLGRASSINKVRVDWTSGISAPVTIGVFGSLSAPGANEYQGSEATATAGGSGTLVLNVPVPCPWATVYVRPNGPVNLVADGVFKVTGIRTFGASAYESGNQSAVTADAVIKAALLNCGQLDQRTDRIAATSFAVPHLAPDAVQQPREVIKAVQAFHDYRFQVAPGRRVVFEPKPDIPIARCGPWPGVTFEDASANSADDTYTEVWVTGRTPADTALRVLRQRVNLTNPGLKNKPPVRGAAGRRSKDLQVQFPLPADRVAARRIGDTWLAAHVTTPFKGTVKVTGSDALRTVGTDMPLAPERLLLLTDELLRFDDRIDPDNGGFGREGRIAQVTYNAAADEAEVTIDDSRADVEAFLSRLGAVTASQ